MTTAPLSRAPALSHLDPLTAVAEIANADCNLDLAAERLNRLYPPPPDTHPTTAASLLALAAGDPTLQEALFSQLRVKAVLDSYQSMTEFAGLMADPERLKKYAPQDDINAYKAFADTFGRVIAKGGGTTNISLPGNVNIYDKVIAMLPPDAREALKVLSSPAPTPDRAFPEDPETYSHAPEPFARALAQQNPFERNDER